MADNCTNLETVIRLKAMKDAQTGRDSSKAFAPYGSNVYKNYLKGYMLQEKALASAGTKKKGPTIAQEVFLQDVTPSFKDPSSVLGERITKPLIVAGEKWQKAVIKGKLDAQSQKELWNDTVSPLAEDMLESLEYDHAGMLSDAQMDYARVYLTSVKTGETVFGPQGESSRLAKLFDPVGRRVDNAVGKLVAWNPDIFLLNFVEYNRVLAKNPVKGTIGFVKSLASWHRIPELKEKGVFGQNPDGHSSGLITLSDNWLRMSSYLAGESLGGGHEGGMRMMKHGAFAYRINDTPLFIAKHQTRTAFTLMRYGVETYKYLGSAASDIGNVLVRTRNGKLQVKPDLSPAQLKRAAHGAQTLLVWGAGQTLLFGGRAAVPLGLWEIYEAIAPDKAEELKSAETDDNQPLVNILGKHVGLQYTSKAQPGGIAFGVGYDVLNRDYEKMNRDFLKAIEASRDGDQKEAFILAGKAGLMYGATTRLPVGNINQQKVYDALSEYWRDELDLSDLPARSLEKVVTLKTPLTTQGQEEYDRKARYR